MSALAAGYTDYLFKTQDTTLAIKALTALQAANAELAHAISINMLGDPILDEEGNVVACGRMGRAASSYTDPDTGLVVQVPAAGDPANWYGALRMSALPPGVTFDPATYGLTVCDPAENAAVLGVWF